jgi:hypothetical protein
MAGIVRITDEKSWSVANWVYWGVMDHVLDALASDPTVAHRVEGCKWMQILSFPLLRSDDAALAERVLTALETVANKCADGTLSCKVDGRILDDDSQQQFREATHELVVMLGETM